MLQIGMFIINPYLYTCSMQLWTNLTFIASQVECISVQLATLVHRPTHLTSKPILLIDIIRDKETFIFINHQDFSQSLLYTTNIHFLHKTWRRGLVTPATGTLGVLQFIMVWRIARWARDRCVGVFQCYGVRWYS